MTAEPESTDSRSFLAPESFGKVSTVSMASPVHDLEDNSDISTAAAVENEEQSSSQVDVVTGTNDKEDSAAMIALGRDHRAEVPTESSQDGTNTVSDGQTDVVEALAQPYDQPVSRPTQAGNRQQRRKNQKIEEVRRREDQAEQRTRQKQRKRSEIRHSWKGVPFEHRSSQSGSQNSSQEASQGSGQSSDGITAMSALTKEEFEQQLSGLRYAYWFRHDHAAVLAFHDPQVVESMSEEEIGFAVKKLDRERRHYQDVLDSFAHTEADIAILQAELGYREGGLRVLLDKQQRQQQAQAGQITEITSGSGWRQLPRTGSPEAVSASNSAIQLIKGHHQKDVATDESPAQSSRSGVEGSTSCHHSTAAHKTGKARKKAAANKRRNENRKAAARAKKEATANSPQHSQEVASADNGGASASTAVGESRIGLAASGSAPLPETVPPKSCSTSSNDLSDEVRKQSHRVTASWSGSTLATHGSDESRSLDSYDNRSTDTTLGTVYGDSSSDKGKDIEHESVPERYLEKGKEAMVEKQSSATSRDFSSPPSSSLSSPWKARHILNEATQQACSSSPLKTPGDDDTPLTSSSSPPAPSKSTIEDRNDRSQRVHLYLDGQTFASCSHSKDGRSLESLARGSGDGQPEGKKCKDSVLSKSSVLARTATQADLSAALSSLNLGVSSDTEVLEAPLGSTNDLKENNEVDVLADLLPAERAVVEALLERNRNNFAFWWREAQDTGEPSSPILLSGGIIARAISADGDAQVLRLLPHTDPRFRPLSSHFAESLRKHIRGSALLAEPDSEDHSGHHDFTLDSEENNIVEEASYSEESKSGSSQVVIVGSPDLTTSSDIEQPRRIGSLSIVCHLPGSESTADDDLEVYSDRAERGSQLTSIPGSIFGDDDAPDVGALADPLSDALCSPSDRLEMLLDRSATMRSDYTTSVPSGLVTTGLERTTLLQAGPLSSPRLREARDRIE